MYMEQISRSEIKFVSYKKDKMANASLLIRIFFFLFYIKILGRDCAKDVFFIRTVFTHF